MAGGTAGRGAPPAVGTASRERGSPSVLVVMGVSGSGKSTVGALLAQRLGWEFEDGDWFHPPANVAKMASGASLTDADRRPWLDAIAAWIEAVATSDRRGVVVCSALRRAYREVLVSGRGDAVRIVYLEGARDLVAARMSLRQGHFMPPALLDSQFATLEIPAADESPLTVSVAGRPQEVVDAILAGLAIGGGRAAET